MVQRRGRLRLPLKAAERLRVASNFSGQELESDEAVQLDVFCFVDHAHTAAAEFFNNAVVRESLADHSGRILVGRITVRESQFANLTSLKRASQRECRSWAIRKLRIDSPARTCESGARHRPCSRTGCAARPQKSQPQRT